MTLAVGVIGYGCCAPKLVRIVNATPKYRIVATVERNESAPAAALQVNTSVTLSGDRIGVIYSPQISRK